MSARKEVSPNVLTCVDFDILPANEKKISEPDHLTQLIPRAVFLSVYYMDIFCREWSILVASCDVLGGVNNRWSGVGMRSEEFCGLDTRECTEWNSIVLREIFNMYFTAMIDYLFIRFYLGCRDQ